MPQPQPDWTAFFPMWHEGCAERLRNPRMPLSPESSLVPIVSNFSLSTLRKLAQQGLEWDASKPGPTQVDESQLFPWPSEHILYPWLAVEHGDRSEMHTDEPDENPSWVRAASSGSAALMMLENLTACSGEPPQDMDMPPFVTITTSANRVRVWIFFLDEKGPMRYVSRPPMPFRR